MAKKTHFDIVFIDVIMPGIDGFQTLEEIKKINLKTKIIIMTGQEIENLVPPLAVHLHVYLSLLTM